VDSLFEDWTRLKGWNGDLEGGESRIQSRIGGRGALPVSQKDGAPSDRREALNVELA
jgi:hypothetical protein